MSITIDLPPATMKFVEEQAVAQNVGVEEYALSVFNKAIHNAEYLAKIDRAFQNEKEGKFTTFTHEEWERFVHEHKIH